MDSGKNLTFRLLRNLRLRQVITPYVLTQILRIASVPGPQTVSSVYLSSGQALDTPRGRIPSKKSRFISASERSFIKFAFFSPREIFLNSNLRRFCKKLASPHFRHISFFICSADSFAERSWNSSADKKLSRKLRFRCFGELRSLKALQARF